MQQNSHLPSLPRKEQLLKSTNSSLSTINHIIDEGTAVYWYEKGVKNKILRNWGGAVYCFSNAIKMDPTEVKYYAEKSYAAFKFENITLTCEALAAGIYRLDFWRYFVESLKKQEWEDLYIFIQKYKEKEDSSYLFSLAIVQLVCGNTEECLLTLNIIEEKQNSLDFTLHLLSGLAKCKSKIRDSRVAIGDFNRAIEQKPSHFVGYHYRGSAFSALKEFDKAIVDFTSAISLKKNCHTLYLNRGSIYFELGQYQKSIEDFTTTIELGPQDYWAYYKRGLAKFTHTASSNKEALEDFNKAIELKPDFNSALLQRARTKIELRDFESSLEDYSRLIELMPESIVLYKERGKLKSSHLFDPEGAIDDYSKILEIRPNNAEILCQRGMEYMFLGAYTESLDDYLRAREIDPEEYCLHSYCAHCKFYLEDYQGVIEELRNNKILGRLDYYYLGFSKYKNADYKGAIRDLTIGIEKYSNSYDGSMENNSSIKSLYHTRGLAFQAIDDNNSASLDFQKCSGDRFIE